MYLLIRTLFPIAIFASLVLFAEEESAYSPISNGTSHSFGAGGTVYRTWGFSYRHHLANNFGFHTNIGGWISSYEGHIGGVFSPMFTIFHHDLGIRSMPQASLRIYGLLPVAVIWRHIRDFDLQSKVPTRTSQIDFGIGLGPGVEFFFIRFLAIHLELPWMTFGRYEEKKFAFRDSMLNIGGGVSYYF